MKNRLSLMLALLLLLSSCSTAGKETTSDTANTTGETGPSSDTEASSEPMTEMEKRLYVKDDLPEKDFNGASFRICTKTGMMFEIDTEETNGDICNDALFERNQRVEDRFNVQITAVPEEDPDGYAQTNFVKQSILAADDAFDLAATYVFTSGPLVTEGCYLNWMNMEYTDLSKPWWIGGINENFRVGDAIYTTVGDMCVTTLTMTYGVFYNRTRGADYDLDGAVFSSIKDGTWTLDKFNTLIADIYSDLNGNNARDEGDFYGFAAEKNTNVDVYTFAFDIPIMKRNAEDQPEIVLNTPKTASAVEKLNDLYWNTPGTCIPEDSSTPISMFKNGQAVFTTTFMNQAFTNFREMEDHYTILPYPKWDESQKNYMTGAMDNYSVLGIPVTVKDPEMASILTEALNIESYRTLFPTYYKEALQDKYARDEESIAMIDLLMQGRNFDFSTLFGGNLAGIPYLIRGLIQNKSKDFGSAYAKIESEAQKGLEGILKAYADNAQS